MRFFSSIKLYHKIFFYSLLAAIVFIVCITLVFFRIETEYAQDKASIIINQLIDTVEPSVSVALYSNNSLIAKETVDGLLRNDVVHKVIIRDYRDIIAEKKKGEQTESQKPIVREIFSPFGEKRAIGQIIIFSEAGFIQQEVLHSIQNSIANLFVLLILLLIFILLLVQQLFSKPLNTISSILRSITAGELDRIELIQNNKDDEIGQLIITINKILDELNTKLSTQKSLRKRVESAEKKLRNIFQSTSAGLFLLDKDGTVLTSTPTLLRILGYEDTSMVSMNGQKFATLFKEPRQFQQMMKMAYQSDQLEAQDLMIKSDNENNPLWIHCLLSKIVDSRGATCFEGVIFDVSKRVAAEKAMQYEANHDALTGLLRRSAAELQLKKHITVDKHSLTIILLLDLDGFKKANDTYGHDAGDAVLIETARRLESCVRHNDIVCRLGGDEFLIILFNCSPIAIGFGIAEQIIASIQTPVAVNDQITVNIGVSIGIALFPIHGDNVESLLKSADESMYEVKRKGKNGYGIKGKNGTVAVNRPFARK